MLEKFKSAEKERHFKKYAFFDIDGTLTKGYAIVAFADYLATRGRFRIQALDEMERDQNIYATSLKRGPDYYVFAQNLVDHYAQGIAGQNTIEISDLSHSFYQDVIDSKVHNYFLKDYAHLLVTKFNRLNIDTIAISGSPEESLAPLMKHLGFKKLISTEIVSENNIYSPRVRINMALRENKERAMGYYKMLGIDFNNSFAFGDSMQDVPLLSAADNAYVLGDNPELVSLSVKNNWKHDSEGRIINTLVDLDLLKIRRDL